MLQLQRRAIESVRVSPYISLYLPISPRAIESVRVSPMSIHTTCRSPRVKGVSQRCWSGLGFGLGLGLGSGLG